MLPRAENNARLLDVGVFPGHFAALAIAQGYSVDGLGNEEMSDRFLNRAATNNVRTHTVDIECELFPADDDTYDVVVCTEIIEHLYRNPFHMLSESFRVLKPGGSLVVTTPNLGWHRNIFRLMNGTSYRHGIENPLDETFPVNLNYGHYREYTLIEIVHMLQEQSQYPYRFHVKERTFSTCWDDDSFSLALKRGRHPLWALLTLRNALFTALAPTWRSCLMVRAIKPQHCTWIKTTELRDVVGFGDVTVDEGPSNKSRRKLFAPYRTIETRASFAFRHEVKVCSTLTLSCTNLLHESSAPIDVMFFVNDVCVLKQQVPPAKAYTSVRLPLPVGNAEPVQIRVEVEKGGGAGVMLAWDRFLVMGEC